jgi:hypothetical protein
MLKIFKINFFILIFSSGVAMAKDIEVFGVKTLENVFEYVDSLSTAEPHSETLGRKYDQIWITPPKLNSVFAHHALVYDRDTKTVQGLSSFGEMFDFDYCLGQMDTWIPRLNTRFSTVLEKFEVRDGGISTEGASSDVYLMNTEQYIDIRCNRYSDGTNWLVLLWRTRSLNDAVSEYYNDF